MKKTASFIILLWFSFTISTANAQQALNVKEVAITVSSIEKLLPFYTEVLPFQIEEKFEFDASTAAGLFNLPLAEAKVKAVRLSLGNETLVLQEFTNAQNRPIPLDSKSNDLWFQHIAIVVSDMDKAYSILRRNRVKHVSTSPQTLPEYITAAAGIKAFYFRDPDGHNLEIIYFPPGKGNPKWQKPNGDIFLGIDHTAIGVSNTPKSQQFYESLGLKLAGKSENFGSEQEHLNQVFGARLEISGFMAQEGIGVEFLEYIAPPGGRPYPSDSQVTDLWHWHSVIEVAYLEEKIALLKKTDAAIISKEIKNLSKTAYQASNAWMVRDPDGHALLLIQK